MRQRQVALLLASADSPCSVSNFMIDEFGAPPTQNLVRVCGPSLVRQELHPRIEKIHLRFLEWIGVKQDHGFASKELASGSASFGSVRSLEGKMNLEKGERFDRGQRSLSTER